MIYPSVFPSNRKNEAEEIVFNKLEKLSDKYDIFYARKFIALSNQERPEYEIDFIISIPSKAIICLEVKGGIIRFEGTTSQWFQNSKLLNPSPDIQATSASHSLLSRYWDIGKNMPISWALCFPDCQIPEGSTLPSSLNPNNIIDQIGTLYIDKALDSIFVFLFEQYPTKAGCKSWEYDNFKNDLLRGLGFVQLLGTRFKQDEERYIKLAERQVELFRHIIENKKILITGPAGSGKTIIAKTLAQELATSGEKILFLCFNRTLGNKINYETGIRNNINIVSGTFHSFTKRKIEELDPAWWESTDKSQEGFWEVEIPAKFEELLAENAFQEFDCLIIDEAQDFKEFWFEMLFKLLKPSGRIVIFLDKMQDIFNRKVEIPNMETFSVFRLNKNCRNTKKIVNYLENVVGENIETENTPEGDEVCFKVCKNATELQTKLVIDVKELLSHHQINNDQILIILNTDKKSSSIASLTKIGKYDLKSLDNKARFEKGCIHFTSIETFKGLEADVVCIIDVQNIPIEERKIKLYTEASRAKHKLYIYEVA